MKNLGCPIYADWNVRLARKSDSDWHAIDVNYDFMFLSIVIIDRDTPLDHVSLYKKIPYQQL